MASAGTLPAAWHTHLWIYLKSGIYWSNQEGFWLKLHAHQQKKKPQTPKTILWFKKKGLIDSGEVATTGDFQCNADSLEKQVKAAASGRRGGRWGEKREVKKNRGRHRIDEVKMEPEMAVKRKAEVATVKWISSGG